MLKYLAVLIKVGLPTIKTGTASEYFKKLHQTVENTDSYVHTWIFELYLEYHRGTYTSQAYKRENQPSIRIIISSSGMVNLTEELKKKN